MSDDKCWDEGIDIQKYNGRVFSGKTARMHIGDPTQLKNVVGILEDFTLELEQEVEPVVGSGSVFYYAKHITEKNASFDATYAAFCEDAFEKLSGFRAFEDEMEEQGWDIEEEDYDEELDEIAQDLGYEDFEALRETQTKIWADESVPKKVQVTGMIGSEKRGSPLVFTIANVVVESTSVSAGHDEGVELELDSEGSFLIIHDWEKIKEYWQSGNKVPAEEG